jgi:hypothetical protein
MIMDLCQKLILIEVDHGLMIMEEGLGGRKRIPADGDRALGGPVT